LVSGAPAAGGSLGPSRAALVSVLYVDLEHAQVLRGERGPAHQARVTEALARLTAAAGDACISMRWEEVSPATVAHIAPAALVLSGSTSDWADYPQADLGGLLAVIRAAPVPILGICAGHQLIGLAHGAAWGPLGPLQAGEADADPRFAPGQRKERGFLPVALDDHCPLFPGLGRDALFFQSHYWQLTTVPAGFAVRARSAWSPIQAIERHDRPVFGVQFHPERFDRAHPAGATVLRHFFMLVRSARELISSP